MLEKLIERLNNTLSKSNENKQKEIEFLRKETRNIQKKLLEDFITTINEIQDTHSMHIAEDEKQKIRNSIVDYKRKQYVEKLIELSSTDQSSR